MASLRQIIRYKALNKKARFIRKYFIKQSVSTTNNKKTTKYSYGKKIVAKKKKYSYKRG